MRLNFYRLCVSCALLFPSAALADAFGNGANLFDIQFVTVGNPNNPADTTGDPNPAGSVPYTYRIGKYEISEDAVRKANTLGGLGLSLDTRGPDKPATSLSWFEAAKFVNWLNTSTGGQPAYKFDAGGNFQLWSPSDPGYDANNLFRNTQSRYFLPSADEWYKAAFYDPATNDYWDYPTGSNAPPVSVASGTAQGTAVWNQFIGPADVYVTGGLGPLGTMGQAGNVGEWEETEKDRMNDDVDNNRGIRGGDWFPNISSVDMSATFRNNFFPEANPINVGFRIASVVPEPQSLALFIVALLSTALRRTARTINVVSVRT